jgi:NitT/TauT family transport system permease protein
MRRGNRISPTLSRAAPAIAVAAFLLLWELACHGLAIPAFLLPPPSSIVKAMLHIEGREWLIQIWATLRVTLAGFTAAIAIGLPLATAIAMSPLLSRTISPILVAVQSTPIVAVAPIIVVSLGANDLPKVVIAFLITFFPIVISTAAGLMSTPPELIELSRSLKAGRRREIVQIRMPWAMPQIFDGLRIGITLAVIGAVVAELVAADQGLGYFISLSTALFKPAQAFAGLFVLLALSLGLFYALTLFQRVAFPWSLAARTSG